MKVRSPLEKQEMMPLFFSVLLSGEYSRYALNYSNEVIPFPSSFFFCTLSIQPLHKFLITIYSIFITNNPKPSFRSGNQNLSPLAKVVRSDERTPDGLGQTTKAWSISDMLKEEIVDSLAIAVYFVARDPSANHQDSSRFGQAPVEVSF